MMMPTRNCAWDLMRSSVREPAGCWRSLEGEVDAYLDAFADERDEHGRRLVTRNGHAEPRTVTTVAGGIEIEAPRVNDRRVDEATGNGSGSRR